MRYIDGILINSENNYIINYDSNGFPISKKLGETVLENYTWKCGRLESVEYELQQRKIVFSYNANGQRTSKKEYFGTSLTNTTRYYYSTSGFLVYETRTLNNVKLEYLYDSEGSLYGVYYNGTPYYYVRDALGTITHIVDSNLNVVTRLEYDGAYGKHNVNDLTSTGSNHISFVNPFRYKGYYYDVETNLFLVTSRYYSPELGRFIQPADVSSLNPSNINGLNLYAYANNNPIGITYGISGASFGTSGGMVNSIGMSMGASYWNNLGNVSSITFPSLYDTLGFASNVFAAINGIKVAKYLTYIHGNPPKVGWFLDNLSKHGKISGYLGYAAAAVDGINVYMNTNDIGLAGWTVAYDIGSMIIASKLGGLIGGLIGGPAGAIIGTLAGIGIEALIQYFKDDVVNWVDKTIDDFINWISNRWGELVNA